MSNKYTVSQLKKICKCRKIKGYSKCCKEELIKKINKNKKDLKKKSNKKKNQIKKVFFGGYKSSLSNEDYNKFLKKIQLVRIKDINQEKIDDLLDQRDVLLDICRGEITPGYTRSAFENKNGMGFMAINEGHFIGFIFFYEKMDDNRKTLYLDLVCGAKNKFTKGIPIGQLLIMRMEKYAKKNNYDNITASSVNTALSFYKKTGWIQTNRMSQSGLIPIAKSLKDDIQLIEYKLPFLKKSSEDIVRKVLDPQNMYFMIRSFNKFIDEIIDSGAFNDWRQIHIDSIDKLNAEEYSWFMKKFYYYLEPMFNDDTTEDEEENNMEDSTESTLLRIIDAGELDPKEKSKIMELLDYYSITAHDTLNFRLSEVDKDEYDVIDWDEIYMDSKKLLSKEGFKWLWFVFQNHLDNINK
jgi:hypothetical protein